MHQKATIFWKRLACATYHQGGTCKPRFWSSSRFPLDAETTNIWSTEYAICVQQFPPRLRKIQIPDPRFQFQGERETVGGRSCLPHFLPFSSTRAAIIG